MQKCNYAQLANHQKSLFFYCCLLISVALPHSDLHNILIEKETYFLQKIEEKSSKKRLKIDQKSRKMPASIPSSFFDRFWCNFLTILGPISGAFWTISSSCGVSWPIFAPSHGFFSVHFGICGICGAVLDQFWYLRAQPPA